MHSFTKSAKLRLVFIRRSGILNPYSCFASILEFFGIKEDELPGMRIIKLAEDMAKYKPESGSLDEDNVRGFVQAYLDGKLKQHCLKIT